MKLKCNKIHVANEILLEMVLQYANVGDKGQLKAIDGGDCGDQFHLFLLQFCSHTLRNRNQSL